MEHPLNQHVNGFSRVGCSDGALSPFGGVAAGGASYADRAASLQARLPIPRAARGGLALVTFLVLTGSATAADPELEKRPAEEVQDNSFLVEEAYNQEPGVVQHILSVTHTVSRPGPDERAWSFYFTQEWPAFSQTHELSYTVPYSFVSDGGNWNNGLEDVLLNYR